VDVKGRPVKKSHVINKNGLPNLLSPILEGDNNKKVFLDEQKAEKLFKKQLGPRFSGVENLIDYQKGLAAAFMAFGSGDKKSAQALLDQMSLSFVEPEDVGGNYKIDVSGADELIEEYQAEDLLKYHTKCHRAFVYPYLMSLYEDYAKAKGVLPSCEFIWLRPINRALWYSLNQMGGREAWIEASAPWEHYHTEKIAGRSIKTPEVKNAVIGLKTILTQKGWLAPAKEKGYDV
jgi:intracellular multiplication protein IcmP